MTTFRPLPLLLVAVLLLPASVHAAGPLIVNGAGTPLAWTASPVPFNPDQGPLGVLSNTDAVAGTVANFDVWTDVVTSSISYVNAGQLPVDVTSGNVFDFLGICGDGLSPIVFDNDGSIVDDLFGPGASNSILGFAGPDCISFVPPAISEGLAVLNGKFIDGIADVDNAEITLAEFNGVFIHEFGHYSNLDHSQINLTEAFDGDAGNDAAIATMFPFLVNGVESASLTLDDEVSISTLYPEPSFASGFGSLTGTIHRSDGSTPFQGAYVIARAVGDPRGTAVGVASGARFFPFSDGGPPPAELEGLYEIPGLPSGDYTIEVEEIPPFFSGGSSVGPLNPPAQLPGVPEFYNGANEAGANPPDDPVEVVTVAATAGATLSGLDVILNAFPPPPNDTCDLPTTIPSLPFTDATDTRGATAEAADASQSCGSLGGNGGSVWYSFTAPADMIVTANTFGSSYDTVLSAHSGPCALLTELGCNDDVSGVQSRLTVALGAGETVRFQVSAFGASSGGALVFNLSETFAPANDECAAATPVPFVPFASVQDALGATAGASDPVQSCGATPDPGSVWYTFTPAADSTLAVTTTGSDYATVLSAYTGSCGALAEVACASGFPSRLTLTVAAGETLRFLVTGAGGFLGFNVSEITTAEGHASDPSGDTIGFFDPQLDLSSVDACFGPDDVSITLAFSTPISPADSGLPNALGGYIDLDVDQDAGTGFTPFTEVFLGLPTGMGIESFVSLFDVDSAAGTVLVVSPLTGDLALADISFQPSSVTITIPRAILGGDDGQLHVAALIGTLAEPTDGAPNGGRVSTVACGGATGCPPVPATTCRTPLKAGRAAVSMLDHVDDRRDVFSWAWRTGPATPVSAFGNPRATTGYDLCVYDEVGGAASLVLASRVPAGGLCGTGARPCWRATQRGFAYQERTGVAGGIRSILLEAGKDGRSEVSVRGRGIHLQAPVLPLGQDPRVTVQLRNDDGSCWAASYSSASANTAQRFQAAGD